LSNRFRCEALNIGRGLADELGVETAVSVTKKRRLFLKKAAF
jgi:hypothetical protein